MKREKKRNEINNEYKWDLTKIYETEELFLEDLKEITKEINLIEKYKGHILDNEQTLYDAISSYFKYARKIEKLYMYAHLNYDSETNNIKYETNFRKIENLCRDFGIITSFIEPELLKTDYKQIVEFSKSNPLLKEYSIFFKESFRNKEHILSLKEEELLNKFSNVLGNSSEVYEKLTDTDMVLGTIFDENKEEVELTDSNYSLYLASKDKEVRKSAFYRMYTAYKGLINTFASTYKGNIEYSCVDAKIRGYNSSLESALFSDNIDVSVYNNLIDAVSNNLEPLYKYYDLKKEILKLDEFHLYDNYVDLIDLKETNYTFLEAKDLVIKSLSVLGNDYISNLNKAFDEHWIDIYPNASKRSGAYSSGGYDTFPYVLLNFQGKLDDVSTLAHELGHSMHSYYSRHNNTYQQSDYTIFVAEVASTVNELLLCKYIIKNKENKEEKLNVINRMLDLFKGTIYRQTMFAEFEKITHEMVEKDEIINSENLSNIYYELNKKYFGNNVIVDEEIKYEWARIPHFYYNFYVYKYATGLSAACFIVNRILKNEENALEDYLKFLTLGGSMYPANELKVAGVDINDPKIVESAIEMFNETINDFKENY
ncbi:MAG: oligoendopeptidase F [Bacilli bacterium]